MSCFPIQTQSQTVLLFCGVMGIGNGFKTLGILTLPTSTSAVE